MRFRLAVYGFGPGFRSCVFGQVAIYRGFGVEVAGWQGLLWIMSRRFLGLRLGLPAK